MYTLCKNKHTQRQRSRSTNCQMFDNWNAKPYNIAFLHEL